MHARLTCVKVRLRIHDGGTEPVHIVVQAPERGGQLDACSLRVQAHAAFRQVQAREAREVTQAQRLTVAALVEGRECFDMQLQARERGVVPQPYLEMHIVERVVVHQLEVLQVGSAPGAHPARHLAHCFMEGIRGVRGGWLAEVQGQHGHVHCGRRRQRVQPAHKEPRRGEAELQQRAAGVVPPLGKVACAGICGRLAHARQRLPAHTHAR